MTVVHVLLSCLPHLKAIFVFQLTFKLVADGSFIIAVLFFFSLSDEGVPQSLFTLKFVTSTSHNRIQSVVLNAVTGAHYHP